MSKTAHGAFAEYAVCPVVSAFEVPEEIPLPTAAGLYFPFHLAWLGLFDRAEQEADRAGLTGIDHRLTPHRVVAVSVSLYLMEANGDAAEGIAAISVQLPAAHATVFVDVA